MNINILYIFLILIAIAIVSIIIVYFLTKKNDKVVYINQHSENSSGQYSRLVLDKAHLNKTLTLDGGRYSIYLQDNLKDENGVITIVHLDDGLDKINIIYPSNIYIVEYVRNDTTYETGNYSIDGSVHLFPNSTGHGIINWHTTVIRISPEMTNVNINCMVLDDISFQTFT